MTTETELKNAFERRNQSIDTAALSARLAARAEAEGVLDLSYCEIDSPIGSLLAVATPEGLIKLGYPNVPADEQLEGLAATISPRLLESPARLEPLRRELDEYFEGRRHAFDIPIDWQLTSGFVQNVLRETAKIPFGEIRTYAQMATSAGSPRAFRAAGSALGANPIPIVVPCHRVLRSGGGLGGYGGGLDVKRRLLEIEGVLG
ncbi:MAG: methylated-DNA--[protein]-cysteine S-methyltransferase [Solirubrobacterales bacterium]|nr:methylated-DNA--[protein]-cysteine S-methyltransferase [Solirubrobacterales bacterium]